MELLKVGDWVFYRDKKVFGTVKSLSNTGDVSIKLTKADNPIAKLDNWAIIASDSTGVIFLASTDVYHVRKATFKDLKDFALYDHVVGQFYADGHLEGLVAREHQASYKSRSGEDRAGILTMELFKEDIDQGFSMERNELPNYKSIESGKYRYPSNTYKLSPVEFFQVDGQIFEVNRAKHRVEKFSSKPAVDKKLKEKADEEALDEIFKQIEESGMFPTTGSTAASETAKPKINQHEEIPTPGTPAAFDSSKSEALSSDRNLEKVALFSQRYSTSNRANLTNEQIANALLIQPKHFFTGSEPKGLAAQIEQNKAFKQVLKERVAELNKVLAGTTPEDVQIKVKVVKAPDKPVNLRLIVGRKYVYTKRGGDRALGIHP